MATIRKKTVSSMDVIKQQMKVSWAGLRRGYCQKSSPASNKFSIGHLASSNRTSLNSILLVWSSGTKWRSQIVSRLKLQCTAKQWRWSSQRNFKMQHLPWKQMKSRKYLVARCLAEKETKKRDSCRWLWETCTRSRWVFWPRPRNISS